MNSFSSWFLIFSLFLVQSMLEEKNKQMEMLIKMKVNELHVGEQFSVLQKLLEQKHKEVSP